MGFHWNFTNEAVNVCGHFSRSVYFDSPFYQILFPVSAGLESFTQCEWISEYHREIGLAVGSDCS